MISAKYLSVWVTIVKLLLSHSFFNIYLSLKYSVSGAQQGDAVMQIYIYYF